MGKFEMRVQFQDHQPGKGKDNTLAEPISATGDPGVTVKQVQDALDSLLHKMTKEKWIGKDYHSEFKKEVNSIKRKLEGIPPAGIEKGGLNIKPLQRTFKGDGKVIYRIDVENLRGHNLRK